MNDLNDMTPQEQAELDVWLAGLVKNADAIERLQDALRRSPEFIALMTTYRSVPKPLEGDAMSTVADFVILFLTQNRTKFLR